MTLPGNTLFLGTVLSNRRQPVCERDFEVLSGVNFAYERR
ncbi:hypothetical protein OP10G_2828 [Fimbriimonas ginsengisoli Gsoil 348]|uniref:Uncharacterized protein n=1 Tax=Fimbriimonas ginsengisoli Gsoil 348 TaxID=661478 RepID=A0A068NRY1_FIMGI|nr:hypothetical protein OP10G_2828 [Fimbriimonas ginsengisoli Gsoil 348]